MKTIVATYVSFDCLLTFRRDLTLSEVSTLKDMMSEATHALAVKFCGSFDDLDMAIDTASEDVE
jgi:hypothetical protein